MTNKIMSINLETFSGLTIVSDRLKVDYGARAGICRRNQLQVNESFAFVWTNKHTFQSNINFRAPTARLARLPIRDVTIDLGSECRTLILAEDQEMRSFAYFDGIPITGFQSAFKPGWQTSVDHQHPQK